MGGLLFITADHPHLDAGVLEVLDAVLNFILQDIFEACDTKEVEIIFKVFFRDSSHIDIFFKFLGSKHQGSETLGSKAIHGHDEAVGIVCLYYSWVNRNIGSFDEAVNITSRSVLSDDRHPLPLAVELDHLQNFIDFFLAINLNSNLLLLPLLELGEGAFLCHFKETDLVLACSCEHGNLLLGNRIEFTQEGDLGDLVAEAEAPPEVLEVLALLVLTFLNLLFQRIRTLRR
mmetsp:Transcript_24250/g.37385  ORF Transcript_24250/g.37385 Transcript_24250/m.37385 type:complete len:231 (-) Transcript_24250:1288-1980(-)